MRVAQVLAALFLFTASMFSGGGVPATQVGNMQCEDGQEELYLVGEDGTITIICVAEGGDTGNPVPVDPVPGEPAPEPKYREWLTYSCFGDDAIAPGCLERSSCDWENGSFLAQLWRQDLDPPSEPYFVGVPFCTGTGTELPDPEQGIPTITIEDVMKFKIAPSPINIQPSPDTLIRFETNFYTSGEAQNFQMSVADQNFDVNVYPIEYTWTYGDGTSSTVGSSGSRLRKGQEADIETPFTHAYQETGTFEVGLTTKFIADFSMNGGPRQAILGTGEVQSPPSIIDVWRTDIRNVDESCVENPDGWGCPGAPTP